jgi:hypothetical protein
MKKLLGIVFFILSILFSYNTYSQCYTPTVLDGERYGTGSVVLSVTAPTTGFFKWYSSDTDKNVLAIGRSFVTPEISQTTEYYVENIKIDNTLSKIEKGAKIDNSGEGGYYEWDDAAAIRGLRFNALSDFTLKSVKVYNQKGQASTRTFTVKTSYGTVVADTTLYVPEGESRLELDMDIPKGEGYTLWADVHKGLFRNSSGMIYPYKIGDAVEITESDLGKDNYYFFYDWEIYTGGTQCVSSRVKVEAKVLEKPNTDTVISLSDYPFIGQGYGELTRPSNPAPGIYLPYVPVLNNINTVDVLYVSPTGTGGGLTESDPASLSSLMTSGAKVKGKTIVALDGTYNLSVYIKELENVNIIAKNKWKAKITGGEGNPNITADEGSFISIHDISIIGFEAVGNNGVYASNSFFKVDKCVAGYSVYNIYLSNMKFHEYGLTLIGGLHSHDWTVDKSVHYNSSLSYLWYSLGYHHSVINSIMYNNTWYSIALRGCYPLEESYSSGSSSNVRIGDRTTHFLTDNDWTHLIVNNTFGSNDKNPPIYNGVQREPAGHHITIFYNIPPDEGEYISEDVYFPMKNVLIANNVFVGQDRDKKRAIVLSADRGVNDPNKTNVASVNGLRIVGNYTDKDKVLDSTSISTDISSIDLSKNTINVDYLLYGFNDKDREYFLSDKSILIASANPSVYVPNVDFFGNKRPTSSSVGACEYNSQLSIVENISNSLDIYPNPSRGIINIKTNNNIISVSIYNMSGELVKKEHFYDNSGSLDLENLTKGMYILRVENSSKYFISKRILIY